VARKAMKGVISSGRHEQLARPSYSPQNMRTATMLSVASQMPGTLPSPIGPPTRARDSQSFPTGAVCSPRGNVLRARASARRSPMRTQDLTRGAHPPSLPPIGLGARHRCDQMEFPPQHGVITRVSGGRSSSTSAIASANDPID